MSILKVSPYFSFSLDINYNLALEEMFQKYCNVSILPLKCCMCLCVFILMHRYLLPASLKTTERCHPGKKWQVLHRHLLGSWLSKGSFIFWDASTSHKAFINCLLSPVPLQWGCCSFVILAWFEIAFIKLLLNQLVLMVVLGLESRRT